MHACNAFENDMRYFSCVTFYFYKRQQQREPELKEWMNMQNNKITWGKTFAACACSVVIYLKYLDLGFFFWLKVCMHNDFALCYPLKENLMWFGEVFLKKKTSGAFFKHSCNYKHTLFWLNFWKRNKTKNNLKVRDLLPLILLNWLA